MGRFLILVAVLAFVGIFVYVFGFHAKGTDGYACALDVARRSPVVADEMGADRGGALRLDFSLQSGGVGDGRLVPHHPGGAEGGRRPPRALVRLARGFGDGCGVGEGRARVVYEGAIPCR